VPYLLALVVGFAYGAADQYLGSLRPMLVLGSWTPTAAQVSAPWLLLPFLIGATQLRPRPALRAGLMTTLAMLGGYFAMTLSPLEGVPFTATPAGLLHLLPGNGVYVVAGLVSGPVYGLLGQRWRTRRSLFSAAAFIGPLCLEPWARETVGRFFSPSSVWAVEAILGLAASFYFAWRFAHERRVPTAP
jgi:Family of unknown function (DUF6518)